MCRISIRRFFARDFSACFGTIYYFSPTFASDFLTVTPAEGEPGSARFRTKFR